MTLHRVRGTSHRQAIQKERPGVLRGFTCARNRCTETITQPKARSDRERMHLGRRWVRNAPHRQAIAKDRAGFVRCRTRPRNGRFETNGETEIWRRGEMAQRSRMAHMPCRRHRSTLNRQAIPKDRPGFICCRTRPCTGRFKTTSEPPGRGHELNPSRFLQMGGLGEYSRRRGPAGVNQRWHRALFTLPFAKTEIGYSRLFHVPARDRLPLRSIRFNILRAQDKNLVYYAFAR